MTDSLTKLHEAVSWLTYEKRLRPYIRAYRKITQKLFTAQGNAFMRALNNAHRALTEANEVAQLDLDFIYEQAVATLATDYAVEYTTAAELVLNAGADAAIRDYTLAIAFDVANPRAVQYLRDYGARLITRIDDVTKARIRDIVAAGVENGDSYSKVAKAIRTEFTSFSKPPIRPAARHIRSRAELVAITEAGNSYQAGNYQAVAQAQDTGLQFEKTWITVGDKRVSSGCRANADEGYIPLDQDHTSGHAHPVRFPGCRCFEGYRRVR